MLCLRSNSIDTDLKKKFLLNLIKYEVSENQVENGEMGAGRE